MIPAVRDGSVPLFGAFACTSAELFASRRNTGPTVLRVLPRRPTTPHTACIRCRKRRLNLSSVLSANHSTCNPGSSGLPQLPRRIRGSVHVLAVLVGEDRRRTSAVCHPVPLKRFSFLRHLSCLRAPNCSLQPPPTRTANRPFCAFDHPAC